ncbi:hypothetical membrane protein, conserved [Thermococcus kodakarensis KOD1]|uniref:Hypothetical membrane protein, conserved n=1 Tax=Thermococcus kodakarensis (strain ATCC BAA-918 / JCM 12380 / KOD1) TaxID=69014 RepID=Q5JDV4_THEKO|nr:hypothetical protein [Thermococcus kodakarensis]WCN27733.1 hypothetical protein POG15_09300 [Thermococcus kodakarensis]WCN30026.1 hypothetical protein POG21_09285 [Thermococcus kodakarensis]BAD86014.1 hypothetical membrane protein, conserved [Thermococcus kodakarensis KOD1]
MEDVKELKSVLEKVEGKLIAAGKMYAAMNFAGFLAVMTLFYVILRFFNGGPAFSIAYWTAATIVVITFTSKVWRRIVTISGIKRNSGKKIGLEIAGAWVIGAALGWVLIPSLNPGINEEAGLAVGFLSFISVSLLGQWAVLKKCCGAENEMVPAFLIPALAIPLAWGMGSGAMLWAGYVVSLGFATTILLYLHSAFKAVKR